MRLGGEDCEECAHRATLWRPEPASLRGGTVGFPRRPTARDRLPDGGPGDASRTDLLEREAELEQIGGALGAAAGGAGGVVVIEGAAGIGKSSLMDETAALAEAGGMVVLRARGGIMEKEFALGVVIQLLAPSVEPLAAREREQLFAGAAGLARPLFEDVPDRAAADDRLFARFHGLHWLCARLAEAMPLALLVDDAHWADEHSLRFLAYLEARIEEIPACVILAVRTGETAAAPEALTRLLEHEPRTAVRPPPLSPAAVARLVRGGLGEDMGDDLCAECARATAGNPLLARQLITALGERGVEPTSLDAGAIAAMGPPSVARFVSARLRRRRRRWAAVARALAILGDDASLADTAEVAGVDREAAASAVDALIDAELLHPALPPRFVHPIIQQALEDSIPPGERAQLHLAAARALARDPARCERAAVHLLATGPPGERWAFDALTAAAQRAGDRGAADHAVRFLRRALEEEAPDPLRRAALFELGAAEAAARMPEAAGHMEEAQRLSSGPAERAQAALGVSMARFLAAELPEAVAACEDGARGRRRARPRAAAGARVPGGRHPPRRRAPRRRDVRAAAGAGAGGAARRDRGGAQPARPDRAGLRGHDRPAGDRGRGARRGGLGRRPAAGRGADAARRARGAGDDGRADRGPDRDRAHGQAEPRDRGVDRGRRRGPGAQLAAALLELPRRARVRPRVDRRPRRRRGRRGRGAGAAARRRSDHPPERAVGARRRPHRARRARRRPRRWCATPGRPASCRSR